jgi:hypothetical protein
MTALTRLIDAYHEYRGRGVDDETAVVLAMDDCSIDGDSLLAIARNCFPLSRYA